MIEIPLLAQQLSSLLAPFLPYLIKGGITAGEEAAKALGKKFSEASWNLAVKVWTKLGEKVAQDPDVEKRVQEVAEKSSDPRAEAMLSWDLEKVLAALQPNELNEIQNMMNQTTTETRTVTASGERSVAIGGNVSGSTISTGDTYNEDKPRK